MNNRTVFLGPTNHTTTPTPDPAPTHDAICLFFTVLHILPDHIHFCLVGHCCVWFVSMSVRPLLTVTRSLPSQSPRFSTIHTNGPAFFCQRSPCWFLESRADLCRGQQNSVTRMRWPQQLLRSDQNSPNLPPRIIPKLYSSLAVATHHHSSLSFAALQFPALSTTIHRAPPLSINIRSQSIILDPLSKPPPSPLAPPLTRQHGSRTLFRPNPARRVSSSAFCPIRGLAGGPWATPCSICSSTTTSLQSSGCSSLTSAVTSW